MAEVKDLVIYGAGGLGREILSLIRRDYADKWRVIGFISDGENLPSSVDGIKLLPKGFLNNTTVAVVLGFADTKGKALLFDELKQKGNLSFPNIISTRASVAANVDLGMGIVIQDFCIVSVNVHIGNAVFLNAYSSLGHDVKICDFCTFMPSVNVSGYASVGKCTMIGAQSFLLQGKTIGDNVTVAAGSKIFNDIPDNVTVFGNPASILRNKSYNY